MMKKPFFFSNKLPYIISVLIIAFILNSINNVKQWEKEEGVINWDIISYYGYLPAVFIYHDYTLNFVDTYKGPHKFTIWPSRAPNGGKVMLTSMGMSILYSPFFFIGHAAAYVLKYDTGGYSEPYRLALILSSVFYLALGLFFLSKMLLKFFNPYISSWVILAIVMGTNLFYYVTYSSAMTHPYSFALITMFLWFTIRWYETEHLKYGIGIGLLIGLISLVRPTNIVVGLFFIFWNVRNGSAFLDRMKFLVQKYKVLIIMALFSFLVWVPQLLYWKAVTGTFFYYSYGEENKFFFNHPMILKGLFGYRHGWIVYSPVMIFSLLGLFVLIKRYKEMLLPVVITFLVFIYVIFSWWCWWYGGAFGMRAMIDLLGLMALPMAAFFAYTLEWKKIWRYTAITISVILFLAGIHNTDKHKNFSSHWDSMTKEAFWDGYLKRGPTPTFESKLRAPDYEKARKGIDAYADEAGK
jgi:hypothetical protein